MPGFTTQLDPPKEQSLNFEWPQSNNPRRENLLKAQTWIISWAVVTLSTCGFGGKSSMSTSGSDSTSKSLCHDVTAALKKMPLSLRNDWWWSSTMVNRLCLKIWTERGNIRVGILYRISLIFRMGELNWIFLFYVLSLFTFGKMFKRTQNSLVNAKQPNPILEAEPSVTYIDRVPYFHQ